MHQYKPMQCDGGHVFSCTEVHSDSLTRSLVESHASLIRTRVGTRRSRLRFRLLCHVLFQFKKVVLNLEASAVHVISLEPRASILGKVLARGLLHAAAARATLHLCYHP